MLLCVGLRVYRHRFLLMLFEINEKENVATNVIGIIIYSNYFHL